MTAVQWERVDTQRALDLLEKAVAERGQDYRYSDEHGENDDVCHYTNPDGSPACIVGVALTVHGVPSAALSEDDTSWITSLTHRLNLTDDAASVFRAAQDTQDVGRSWGEALANARSMAAMLAEQAASKAVAS